MLDLTRKAVDDLKSAASSHPSELNYLNVARALLDQNEPRDAVKYASRALKVAPNSWVAHMVLAKALVEQAKPLEAANHAEAALRLKPDCAAAVAAFANILQDLGRFDEARDSYRRAMALDDSLAVAYTGFVRSGKVGVADANIIERMRQLCQDGGTDPKPNLHYALGKAFDDLGCYESAIEHFDEANRLLQSGGFDRALHRANHEFAINYFDRSLIKSYAGLGHESPAPIFVVGMLRSGTTLVEQILSSHPSVGSGGEQSFWSARRSDALRPEAREVDFAVLHPLAFEYLAMLNEISPGKPRVVDKMPGNYAVLGLIHIALPNAKVVHVMRNPADTCLSIYCTPNRSRVSWSHSQPDIVFAYEEYRRLMAHWRSVLPLGTMLDLSYEQLVGGPEAAVRQLLEFLDLPWSDSCLRPEANPRAVSTPSNWQVRQPIYKSSINKWRQYAAWTEPFGALLGEQAPHQVSSPENTCSPLRRAKALEELHRGFEAIAPNRESVLTEPSADLWMRISELELAGGGPRKSLDAANAALKIDPNCTRAHEGAALALMALNRIDEADRHWKRVLALSSGPDAEIRRARALTEHGLAREASVALEQILERFPGSVPALAQFAWIAKPTDERGLLKPIEKVLANPNLADRERRTLEFAAGKVAADLNRFDEAMMHFDRGNRLALAALELGGKFNRAGYSANLGLRREAFSCAGFKSEAAVSDSEVPIFVIGNMRSGTTLVDRILAAHPLVASAGELEHWTVADPLLIDYFKRTVAHDTLRNRAEVYLQLLERFRGRASRVVDKQPGNILLAGALHMAYPNARIVCVRRSLVDTAISTWTTHIRSTARYLHSKTNLAFALREHSKLADHWRETIPDDRFHTIRYEELAASPESVTRELIEFCGLPWNEACLAPESAPGRVATPSASQVRQPIHQGSIGRWRSYQPWLGEFRQLLSEAERDLRSAPSPGARS